MPSLRKKERVPLPPFFHNLLFMSDRPPPDKWLPYGERKTEKAEGKEGRKEGKKTSPSPRVLSSGVLLMSVFFDQFLDQPAWAVLIFPAGWDRVSCLSDGSASELHAASSG